MRLQSITLFVVTHH